MISSNQTLAASLFSPASWCATVTKTKGFLENFPCNKKTSIRHLILTNLRASILFGLLLYVQVYKSWNQEQSKELNIANRRKIDSLAGRPSPPLWNALYSRYPTHGSALVSQPVYRHVRIRHSLVKSCCHYARGKFIGIDILNPRYRGIMDVRLITGIQMIDSYLSFNGFVRIEYKGLQTNNLTKWIPQGGNVRHAATATL